MAIINCPECGKEISDTSKKCINCGYKFKKKINKKIIITISTIVSILLIISALIYFIIIKPNQDYKNYIKSCNQKYDNAITLAEQGKYEKAINILNELQEKNYAVNVSGIKEELKYESKLYKCISSIKETLKNPDSLQLYEVKFYEMKNKENNTVCIIRYGAQNGFGGNGTGYAIFSNDCKLIGTCDSLKEYENDNYSDKYTCNLINSYLRGIEIGKININRVKTILKNDAYSSIKVIN